MSTARPAGRLRVTRNQLVTVLYRLWGGAPKTE